ncbi:MBOAT family O-acyltransferase [Nonlabens tegetincola]|nr:MBOAT family O-acyltransferase [Nonlabens tegetincola]
MLFNSLEYLVFLPLVFALFWMFKSQLNIQNLILLIASYVFYGWWDYRFLALIAFSTIADYVISHVIERQKPQHIKKCLLIISICINLGLLGFFKYYNFFIESWVDIMAQVGFRSNVGSLNIILPVGISFYTFQTLSYTIDVYRGDLRASRSFVNFATYVSFFPQLVAGPIERATNLLPQFSQIKKFNNDEAIAGLNLIIWGLFQKIVIADSCAIYVDSIFENYEKVNSFSLLLGAIYFAFQIYGDFAGYSNIAIGTARLFGFNLMRNFNYPYFSRDIAEFWRRWHISLSTWFRDYLYIPLGGSRSSMITTVRNVFIVFLVSGFWHGANWTFLVWGGIHAILFLPVLLLGFNRKNLDQVSISKLIPSFKELFQMTFTFIVVSIAWVFFRADNVTIAFKYLKRLVLDFSWGIEFLNIDRYNFELLLLVLIVVLIEWINRTHEHPFMGKWKWFKIFIVILMLLTLGVYSDHQDFIYFQF